MVLKQKRVFWQIFPLILAIILISIALVSWYGSRSVDTFYIEESGIDLENRANLISDHVLELLNAEDIESLRAYCIDSGRASATRITIVAPSGTVLADTNENPDTMDNHRSRPEIDEAFDGVPGRSLRFSNTLGERMLYSAIPLIADGTHWRAKDESGTIIAVLRLSMPVTAIDTALRTINRKILGGTALAVFAAFIVTLLVCKNISRPLEDMTRTAERYSQGDFSQRMLITQKKTTSLEVATLATALNRMADQLDEKIKTIINQRNQLETVFSSMTEAVIAVSLDENIVSINAAAARLFGIEKQTAQGCLVQEVIRNIDLHKQIHRILGTGESFEDELVLAHQNGSIFLQTHAVSLLSGEGATIGALLVLNDVTRLRRLETMRSDFVANVSHELRTPITSIRGYVETLLDGAIDDRDDALQFLEIVLIKSEQLSEIIDDLLALSKIEKDVSEGEVDFEHQQLLPVLERAVQNCQKRATGKNMKINLACEPSLYLSINETLLEHAVANLLNNAITYSEKDESVDVRADREEIDGQYYVSIRIIDRGIGIAQEHLPRLFERFYRSDKARNRQNGGTGLGLAIVKHIIQAHGGTVEVSSTYGEGSEFIITLKSS
ncbi:MAG: PAS domain-containing protein [Desulfobacterales bacterium]|nr:PAS domain-containing protein [Deltaproteobacteria bacterium]NNK96026.1 PAS domain-containing protein [Desulfobacterales bacterium]